MQGIFIAGTRPKSKKAIKEQAALDASKVVIEATSVFGSEYGGPATNMPEGDTITFVGPDPYTKRVYYGTITRRGGKITVK